MKTKFLFFILFVILSCCYNLSAQKNQTNEAYKSELAQLLEDDQKFRTEKNLEEQIPLDKLTRKKLDALYNQYGFPTINKVGRKGLMAAILILHHSEDCLWNEKWVRIFLDHDKETRQFDTLVRYMFVRTYGAEGHCISPSFIEGLKKDYSQELIEYFEIDKL